MTEIRIRFAMGAWLLPFVTIIALLLPLSGAFKQQQVTERQQNFTLESNSTETNERKPRAIHLETSESVSKPTKMIMGDSIGLDTALDSQDDMLQAAGEHKKYVLVKKKPKHKKIKMEIYKPKMKYKKIKMKVPVKKMKKKKVKGYLVKKEKHSYH